MSFTDPTCFSYDLLEFAVLHGLLTDLIDCTGQGDVSQAVTAFANFMAKDIAPFAIDTKHRKLLLQVVEESGGWVDEDITQLSFDTLLERAIFCSLPDPLSLEFQVDVISMAYSAIHLSRNIGEQRQYVRDLCRVIDEA